MVTDSTCIYEVFAALELGIGNMGTGHLLLQQCLLRSTDPRTEGGAETSQEMPLLSRSSSSLQGKDSQQIIKQDNYR